MKKLIALVALCVLTTPAYAKLDETSKIKSTRVVAMSAGALTDCLTLKWGMPLISTKYGENSTRLGFAFMGTTFSVLILTPVDGGTKVERQGNRIGEQHLARCATAPTALWHPRHQHSSPPDGGSILSPPSNR